MTEHASGNPFFIEEIVRTLADTGVLKGARGYYQLAGTLSSIEVPSTLQAVLAARIDTLPIAEKHLLQEMAVIGQDTPFSLLQAICGLAEDVLRRLLDNLQSAEFLYTTQLFPNLQYTFKHSLTRDVAYSGVLRERRREIHACIVDAIEILYVDRLAEQVERLAHHAVQGELKAKAAKYLHQAGAKAAGRSALSEALSLFEQALEILKSLPETETTLEQRFEIHLDLRPVLRQLGEGQQMLQHLREAEAISEVLKDDLRRGRVCAFMTTVLSTFDDLEAALATGTRALNIALRSADLSLRIVATSYLGQAHYYRGDYGQVVELAEANLTALPVEWVHEYFGMAVPPSIFNRVWLIMSLGELGRFHEAADHVAVATQLAEATKHTHSIAWTHFAASMLHLLKGDWPKARFLVEHWLDSDWSDGRLLVEHWINLPWAVAASAWTLAESGETREALSRIREAEALLERQAARGVGQHRSWAYGALGHACLSIGACDEARRFGHRSVESSQHQPGFTAHAHLLLGDIALHPDQFDAETSTAHYQKALALAERYGMRPIVAHCNLGIGHVYRRTGKLKQARESITTATNMYREMDMTFWVTRGESEQRNSNY